MLTPDERMDNIEAIVVQMTNDYKDLATFDELDAIVEEVFDKQEELADRINSLKNNTDIVRTILSQATG